MKRIAERQPIEITPVISPREIMESRKVVDQIYIDEKIAGLHRGHCFCHA